jgi:hypothetical protein
VNLRSSREGRLVPPNYDTIVELLKLGSKAMLVILGLGMVLDLHHFMSANNTILITCETLVLANHVLAFSRINGDKKDRTEEREAHMVCSGNERASSRG